MATWLRISFYSRTLPTTTYSVSPVSAPWRTGNSVVVVSVECDHRLDQGVVRGRHDKRLQPSYARYRIARRKLIARDLQQGEYHVYWQHKRQHHELLPHPFYLALTPSICCLVIGLSQVLPHSLQDEAVLGFHCANSSCHR